MDGTRQIKILSTSKAEVDRVIERIKQAHEIVKIHRPTHNTATITVSTGAK